jgi:hypothetical protein
LNYALIEKLKTEKLKVAKAKKDKPKSISTMRDIEITVPELRT